MRRAFAFGVVLVILAGLAGGLAYLQFVVKPEMIRGFIAKAPPPAPTVSVAVAKAEEWTPQIPAIGTLRAVAGIDIAPQVAGVITVLRFDRGEDVAKGALLVQLDDSVEQADLRSNLATLKNAELTLDRQKQLVSGGNTARSTVDQAQATRDSAAAAVERSKAVIAQKVIYAPFSGRVGLRRGDVGQYVSPGVSLANLQQLDPIYVDFPVPEQNLNTLKVGQDLTIGVDAFAGRKFKGKINAIDARVSADTRNVLVRGEVPNPDKILLPGMFANVSVLAGAPSTVVTLPRTSITYSLYGDSVFVANPPPAQVGAAQVGSAQTGSAQAAAAPADQLMVIDRRVVTVGDAREDRVAILKGVAAGDKIVSEGQLKLQPGMHVRVDNGEALPPPPSPRPKE